MRRATEWISGWALRRRVAAAAAVLFAASIVAPVAEAAPASTSRRIREVLEWPDGLRIDGHSLDVRALERFYRPRDFAPAWDVHDRALDRTALLLRALATADAHGLDPGRYHLDAIRTRQSSSDGGHTAELDLLLTAAFLGYASDVRAGRLPPGRRDPDWGIPASPFDAVSALTQGVRPTYWAAGRYVRDGLIEIDRLLRDHRSNTVHPIDRRLLDVMGALRDRRETREPFEVISGYRSPATNAKLVATTSGVASTSLHVAGMAVDLRVPGRPLVVVRDAAKALGAGGVGYYPDSNFVHVDVGRVRYW